MVATQALWSQFYRHLPVHLVSIHCRVLRAIGNQSTVRSAAIVRLFAPSPIHWQCANKHCVRSIHRPQVPSLFRTWVQKTQRTGGWLQTSTILAHRTVPGVTNAPSHNSFTHCLAVSTHRKRTVHAVAAYVHCQFDWSDMSFDDICWNFSCTVGLRTTFNRRFLRTSPVQAHFTAMSNARMKGSLSHRNTTLWCHQIVQFCYNHHHHLATWEVNSFCGNQMSTIGIRHSNVHDQDWTVSTLLHFSWCLSARHRPWTQTAHHDRKLARLVSRCSSIS